MNAIHQSQIVVARPPVPAKPVRISPPRLDQMHADAAIAAAIAQRDKLWSEAVRVAGGMVQS
jgi:hypothetical protein